MRVKWGEGKRDNQQKDENKKKISENNREITGKENWRKIEKKKKKTQQKEKQRKASREREYIVTYTHMDLLSIFHFSVHLLPLFDHRVKPSTSLTSGVP
ncbi:hypothetical protein VN97_g10361 [Penicillium thymicola]|uniref:Uncharacterized protein n=1 Tax=Penicillium thymicola TaxID=293382 RepID=A0AAI9T947_PENTH|nr:hypothetical protein VN97_g10361 [Penicillium thymicola]